MAIRVSTGARNRNLGDAAPDMALMAVNTIAIVDGGEGSDTITDTDDGFVTAGFVAGDTINIAGSTADDGAYPCTGVAAGTLTFATGSFTGQAAGNVIALAAARGGSVKDTFRNGIIKIYSGSQPANADTAASGTHLLTVTVGSGAFTAGAEANGLEFGTAASGEIAKATGEVWSGVGLADGTAGWGRFYANATDAGGASTTLYRIDFSVGTTGADLNMSSTSIVTGSTYTIDTFKLTRPYQYGA
jgi:hypothetical protein